MFVLFRLADTLLVTPLSSEILFLPMSANVVVQGMYQRYSIHGISVHGVIINLLGVSLCFRKSILFKIAMSHCQVYFIHVYCVQFVFGIENYFFYFCLIVNLKL